MGKFGAGRKIVGVASVAKCWRQKRFRGVGVVLSQSTFLPSNISSYKWNKTETSFWSANLPAFNIIVMGRSVQLIGSRLDPTTRIGCSISDGGRC